LQRLPDEDRRRMVRSVGGLVDVQGRSHRRRAVVGWLRSRSVLARWFRVVATWGCSGP
jgi:hypothetical protein